MGMVYQAEDTHLDETVALKVIRPDLARESRLHERFRSEIKLARRIRHKNVCSIFGDGEEHGILWICMELVDGLDLRRLLRTKGALPPSEAYDVAIQIAEGLQAMHDAGVIHRDLKTANVMRDSRGVVRLMDFGLAKQWRAEESAGPTASGHVVGTPDYMSPEQARGEKLTFASDLYALGVIGFELFTGEPPFRGDTPLTTLFKHLNDPPPFEGDLGRRLPRALVPVLRKALAKRPGDRHSSAGEIVQALRAAQAQASDDVSATPLRLPQQSDRAPTLDAAAPTDRSAATEDMSAARLAVPPARPPRTSSFSQPLTARRWGGVWFLVPLGVVALVIASGPLLMRLSPTPVMMPAPSPMLASEPSAPPATLPAPAMAAPAMAAPAEPVPSPLEKPEGIVDDRGDMIDHQKVGCVIAGQFPQFSATLRAEPAAKRKARAYFKSALSESYYFVEMSREGRRVTAKLPKPKLEASPISYYIRAALADGRLVQTTEAQAVVARSAGECPAGSRVAAIGPRGAVTVFAAKLAMISLRDSLGLEDLVGQLKDSDPGVRESAAEALRAVSAPVRTVVQRALVDMKDPDPVKRANGAADLEQVSDLIVKDAMIPLIAALRDPNPAVQIEAANSLGEIGPLIASAASALRSALRDGDSSVRRAATDALAQIGSVVGSTLAALQDVPGYSTNPELRKAVDAARQRIDRAVH